MGVSVLYEQNWQEDRRRVAPRLLRRRPFLWSPLADGVLPVRGPASCFFPPFHRKFIALGRSVSFPGAFEDTHGFRTIGTATSIAEIVFRSQSRNLLRHGDVDELVQGYSLQLCSLSQFFQ